MSIGAEQVNGSGAGRGRRESLDKQAGRLGIKPIRSVDDMVCLDAFESDEELDAFLAHVHAERQANLA